MDILNREIYLLKYAVTLRLYVYTKRVYLRRHVSLILHVAKIKQIPRNLLISEGKR